MKDIRKYKYSIAAMFSLLLLVLSGGCSKDEGGTPVPEKQFATMVITLGCIDNSEPTYTRADNDITDSDADDTEFEHHIDKWYIVVVENETDLVDRVISNNNANNTDVDSKTNVEMELPVGETYRFYAFANINGLSDTDLDIDGWKDKPFIELRKTEVELAALTEYKVDGKYIPMSSYGETKIVSENENDNKVELQLIRLIGKVSVDLTNATGVDLTVKSVTVGKFRQTGSIYLMPYDAINNDPDRPNLLVGMNEEELQNPVFPEPNSNVGTDWTYKPTDTDKSIGKGDSSNKRTYQFYINETNQASVGTNGEDIEIALDITGEGIEKDNSRKPTGFSFVRRNDWIKIPLLISNAETSVSFEQQHMPIGGLPAVVHFKTGVDVSSRTFETDHAGNIKITYCLNKLNNSATDWSLKYYSSEEQSGITSADHFCYAALVTMNDNAEGLLLEPTAEYKDGLTWWNVPYDELEKPVWAYKMNAETENKEGTVYDETKVSGSFTINIQELSRLSTATIKLVLVAENSEGTEILLPYTLVIKNKGQEEGGN